MLKLSHMLDALHEIPDTREAEPERFDAWFAVGLAAEEAAEHRDLADDLAKGRWLGWRLLLRQDVAPFHSASVKSALATKSG